MRLLRNAVLAGAAITASLPGIGAADTGKLTPPPVVVVPVPVPPAPVEGPADAPPITAEQRPAYDAAMRLLAVTDYAKTLEESAVRIGDMMFTSAITEASKNGEQLPPELLGRLRLIVAEEMSGMSRDMKATAPDRVARVYIRYFNVAEIDEMARIQSMPVMRKAARVMPRMLPEMMAIGMDTAKARAPLLRARLLDAIITWARQHPKQKKPT